MAADTADQTLSPPPSAETTAPIVEALTRVPAEELRFALVLNGGVSLAVWMGGVANEIDRLTRSSPDDPLADSNPYGPVLGLARTQAVVDVISGTSAGGINGAALALAQVNKNANLAALRSLWAEEGSMDALLRKPFVGQPTSLLKGDEYFLPQLEKAMKGLVETYERRTRPALSVADVGTPDDTEIDLTITTTLLTAASVVTADSLGQRIPEDVHAGHFTFASPLSVLEVAGEDRRAFDPFDAAHITETARRIALAARCSASFPFAFEPAFVEAVEVGRGVDLDRDGGMTRFADWARLRPDSPGKDRSRFVVDGGVLANTPTEHALDAIDKRPADGPVRRVMMLVYPHAPADREQPADTRDTPPTVLKAATGILGALQSQGSQTFAHEIEDHNRKTTAWRGGRTAILENMSDRAGRSSAEQLYDFVGAGWRHYVALRQRGAAQSLAEHADRHDQWPFERIREAAERAQANPRDVRHPVRRDCPYVPIGPPPRLEGMHWQDDEPTEWPWGPTVAEGVTDSIADILRSALSVATRDEAGVLSEARLTVSKDRMQIRRARRLTDAMWSRIDTLRGLEPSDAYWRARLVAYRQMTVPSTLTDRDRSRLVDWIAAARVDQGGPESNQSLADSLLERPNPAPSMAESVWDAVGALTSDGVWTVLSRIVDSDRAAVAGLSRWKHFLKAPRATSSHGREAADRQKQVLARLIALDAATWLVASATPTGTSLPMKLVQMSLRIDHPFARESVDPDDKVAGMAIARFSGFLKESWRMNDWAWGRLDAVAMLCRIVLDPVRLRRIGAMLPGRTVSDKADALLSDLESKLYLAERGGGVLINLELRRQAREELVSALDPDAPRPLIHLPKLAAFVAYPIQARIIVEELPVLAAAVRRDRGSRPGRSRGERFLLDQEALLNNLTAADPDDSRWYRYGPKALAAFDHAGIGRETVVDEAGSDALIRTATTATGVIATVIDSDNLGVRALKPVTRVLRGVVMVPYFLITGITSPPGVVKFLAMFGFLAGGAILALSLLGTFGTLNGAAALIGVGALLGALGYSALRTGSLLHGVVLLGPLVPVVALAVDRAKNQADVAAAKGVAAVAATLGVAAGLAILASLPWPMASPLATIHRLVRSRRLQWAAGVVAVVAVGCAGIVGLTSATWDDLGRSLPSARDALVDFVGWIGTRSVGITLLFFALATAIGTMVALVRGLNMRVWRPVIDEDYAWALEREVSTAAGVDAGWAVVYGAGYAVVGTVVLAATQPSDWVDVSIAWFFAMSLVLVLVCPVLITWHHRHVVRRQVRDAVAGLLAATGTPPDVLALLRKRDQVYLYLASSGTLAPWAGPARRGHATGLDLTRRGRRLSDPIPPP